MDVFMKKFIAFCLCAAAFASPTVPLSAGSTPQDVTQLNEIEKMTDSELEFQGKLSGDAVEAFIQMGHAERASVMNMVNTDNGALSPNDAVLMAFKKHSAKS